MSYDISMVCKCCGCTVDVPHFTEGGTHNINGTTKADLNITYNYAGFYSQYIDKEEGIRWIYGKTGEEVRERLESAISHMRNDVVADYWTPTEGNARLPLERLLSWAIEYPNAVFEGD